MKVLWSSKADDRFLTYSHNVINLYQTHPRESSGVPKGSIGVSEETYATQIGAVSEVQLMKCVAWYPGDIEQSLIAIGQANGKVFLSNFRQNENSDLVGMEFIPKHMRQCNYLSWNPVHTNLLAEGLDRHRNDNCINVWDITSKMNNDFMAERQRYSSSLSDTAAVTKPAFELGFSDTSSSFSWFKNEPTTFVTGMNSKSLRVYDIRDQAKAHLVTHTKSVYGLCTDPLHSYHIASYIENQVSVWDVRNFDRPTIVICKLVSSASKFKILTLQELRPVLNIDWCPTRMGLLAVLSKDSVVVKLHDIKHSVTGTDELEPVTIEQKIQPHKMYAMSHFDWHPRHENRLLTVTPTGMLRDSQIFEKLSMALSPNFSLTLACGKKMVIHDYSISDMDIAVRMKARAIRGYGLHIDHPWSNAEVVQEEPHLHALWHWLDLSKALSQSDAISTQPTKPVGSRFIGVQGLLRLSEQDQRSDIAYGSWVYPEGTKSNTTSQERKLMYQYKSAERTRALQMCGWWSPAEKNNRDPLNTLLDSLVHDNNEYERAAAIALFNLKIGKAIDILSSTSLENDSLSVVAMALSGFTEEKNAMWKKTCSTLRHSLDNPYLRAMFSFLGADRETYDEVLRDEPSMAVKDRVAFACIYLTDNKLHVYLRDLCQHMKERGNLDGILLTGMTSQGLDLLEKHVDLTGDIQTAALATVYSFPNEIAKDERVRTWIDSYRSLLDRWQLWHQRAKFDIIRHSVDNSIRVPGQAFVSCNFCGKSIACNMTLAARSKPQMKAMLPSTHKPISCCPGCRKPLPRCALCLKNLGSPSGSAVYQQKDKLDLKNQLSPINNWFTWCQTCRHGGHTSHIMEWFKGHLECPVTGCSCKCMALDPASKLVAETSQVSLAKT